MRVHPTSRRVLVVGATGCGGRAVVEALRAAGHDVLGLARGRTAGPPPDLVCDRHDTPTLRRLLRDFRPEVIVDHVAYTERDVRLLLAEAPPDLHRYILIGSAVVYGPARGAPYDEGDPLRPRGPLAEGKRAAEDAARRWGHGEREAVCVRLGALYGPGHAPLTPWGRDPTLPDRLRRGEALPVPADDPPALQPWFSADHGRLVAALAGAPTVPPALNAAGDERLSWADWLATWALVAGAPPPRLELLSTAELTRRAPPALRPFVADLLHPPVLRLDRLAALRRATPALRAPTPAAEGCARVLATLPG